MRNHTIEWQCQRGDSMLDVVVTYDIEPYVPACTSGPADNWYPAEGGCVTDLVARKPGDQEAVIDLTAEERDEVAEWIERNHDHNEDRYGDPDAAYDQWRDDEMMCLHEPGYGWDD